MATNTPLSDEKRAEVIRLHGEGLSRNEIARRVSISGDSVSRICGAAGLTFDRTMTKQATEAKQIDLAAGRTRLAEKMLAAAEDMLDRIDEPYLVYSFGGRDNEYNEHTLTSAPVEVRRNIITTAGITFDKLTRIVERESGGTEAAIGLLDHAAAALSTAADALRDEGSTDAGSE